MIILEQISIIFTLFKIQYTKFLKHHYKTEKAMQLIQVRKMYIVLVFVLDCIYSYNDTISKIIPGLGKINLTIIHQLIHLQQLFSGLFDAHQLYYHVNNLQDALFMCFFNIIKIKTPQIAIKIFLDLLPNWRYKTYDQHYEKQSFFAQQLTLKQQKEAEQYHCYYFNYNIYNYYVYNNIILYLQVIILQVGNYWLKHIKLSTVNLYTLNKLITYLLLIIYYFQLIYKKDIQLYQPLFYFWGVLTYQSIHVYQEKLNLRRNYSLLYILKKKLQTFINPSLGIFGIYCFCMYSIKQLQEYDINKTSIKLLFTTTTLYFFQLIVYFQEDTHTTQIFTFISNEINSKYLGSHIAGTLLLINLKGTEIGPANLKTVSILLIGHQFISLIFSTILNMASIPYILLEIQLFYKAKNQIQKRLKKKHNYRLYL